MCVGVRDMTMTVAEIAALLNSADQHEFEALQRSLQNDTRKGVIQALKNCEHRLLLEEQERARVLALYDFDKQRKVKPEDLVVGLDEVGRGSVAGPLAVGAVVLDSKRVIEGLNDSKKISPDKRKRIAQEIKENAIAWHVFYVEAADIDRQGMARSLRQAFSGALQAIDAANPGISKVLIDGNPLGIDEREESVVKGDSKSASIAAASIIAKVERDTLMEELDSTFPQYGFSSHKGYGSQEHIEAIKKFGLSSVHRETFCQSFIQPTLF